MTGEYPPSLFAQAMRWAGGVGIVIIAVMRCVISFAPQIVFDIDPGLDPTPLAGLGPGGSLLLDALLLLACACALVGEVLTKRGVDWMLLVLALAPAPLVIWHGLDDAGNLWRGSTWMAGMAACAVGAHLARDRSMRVILLALLLGVIGVLMVRGAGQILHEFPRDIAQFERSKDAFFAARGWEADSSQALAYERRLRATDPTAWFVTTNIFASFMAVGFVVGLGAAICVLKKQLGRAWGSASIIWAGLCAAGLVLSGSKGAMLAAAGGSALLVLPVLHRRVETVFRRRIGIVAVGLIIAALLGVVVRGALLPESFLGDKSLLFRWHYLVSAGRVIAEHVLTGVGPDGFKAAYTVVRVPRNPEEVISAHSMFVDWATTLGVVGTAWTILVLVLLRRSGRASDTPGTTPGTKDNSAHERDSRVPLYAALAVVVLGLFPAFLFEAIALDTATKEATRIAGVLAYVVGAAGLTVLFHRLSAGALDRICIGAVVALVIHGQIEMTFFDPGSAVWALCLVGLVGGSTARRGGAIVGYASAAVLLAGSVWLAGFGVAPARRAQQLMIQAADTLYPPAESRAEQARQRWEAAGLLRSAYDHHLGADYFLIEQSARQFAVASSLTDDAQQLELLERAIESVRRAIEDHHKPSSIALAGELYRRKALRTKDDADWSTAIEFARRMTELDRYGIGSWKRLGDFQWERGRHFEAAQAYDRALQSDANFELDELKQLPPHERRTLLDRIEQASSEHDEIDSGESDRD
jgi:hypothetical protein